MAEISKTTNNGLGSVKGPSKGISGASKKMSDDKDDNKKINSKNDKKENVEVENIEDLTENEYKEKLKKEKKKYKEPLKEIEKELAALEYLDTRVDYRQWTLKYKDKYDLDELKEIARRDEFSKYRDMDDLKKYKQELEKDKETLEAAIYKVEQLEKTVEYDYLDKEEDYQNYEVKKSSSSDKEIEKIDLDKLFSKVYDGNLESYCRLNDIDYDKINELDFVKYVKENSWGGYNNYYKDETLDNLIELNVESLIKKYNYIFENEGKEAASEYLEAMKDELHQMVGMQRANKFLNSLEKDENGNYDNKAIANYLDNILKGGKSGLSSFFEGIEAWGEKEHIYTINEYESIYILQALKKNKSFTNFLDNTYELSESVGNMLPSVLIGVLTTPAGGTASMAVSAGGSSYHQAAVSGEGETDSAIYGILSGLSEATLQRFLGAIPGLNDVKVTSWKSFAESIGKEGLEEGVQEIVDAVLQTDIFDKDFNVVATLKDSLKAFIYGSLIGGVFNGGNFAVNKISKGGNIDTNVERTISDEHGFQLDLNDIKGFYKAKLDSGFFTKDQINNIISSINSKGYISENTGDHLLSLFDGNYDIYIKTIHSNDLNSINEKGIYCNGTSTSIGGGVPQNINDINIENTITRVDNIIDILRVIKNSNGFSQGMNPTDGTLIIKVPKGADMNSLIYYNKSDNAFCITPECIDSFIKVDSNGVEQKVSDKTIEEITEKLGDEITEKITDEEVTDSLFFDDEPTLRMVNNRKNPIDFNENSILDILNSNSKTNSLLTNLSSLVEEFSSMKDKVVLDFDKYTSNEIIKEYENVLALNELVKNKEVTLTEEQTVNLEKILNDKSYSQIIESICFGYLNTKNQIYNFDVSNNTLDGFTREEVIDHLEQLNIESNDFNRLLLEKNIYNMSDLKLFSDLYTLISNGNFPLSVNSLKNLELASNYYLQKISSNNDKALLFGGKYGIDQHSLSYLSEYNLDTNDLKDVYDKVFSIVNSYFPNMKKSEIARYLQGIDSTGACSYASVLNDLYMAFYGKEDLFKKIFGYDMFREINGNKIINDVFILSDFYTYVNYWNESIFKKDLFGNFHYVAKDHSNQFYITNSLNGVDVNFINSFINYKIACCNNPSIKQEYKDYKASSVLLVRDLIYPDSLLSQDRTSNDVLKNMIINAIEQGRGLELGVTVDFVNNKNFVMYKFNSKTGNFDIPFSSVSWRNSNLESGLSEAKRYAGHSMAITGVLNDGVIVASWGSKYYIPFSEMKNIGIDISSIDFKL